MSKLKLPKIKGKSKDARKAYVGNLREMAKMAKERGDKVEAAYLRGVADGVEKM